MLHCSLEKHAVDSLATVVESPEDVSQAILSLVRFMQGLAEQIEELARLNLYSDSEVF